MNSTARRPWNIALGLLPAVAIYLSFAILPILVSFFYAFTRWDGLSPLSLVGLRNFHAILADPVFWLALRNNFLVVLASVCGQIPLGLALALAVQRRLRGARFFRSVIFMPFVISTVVVSLVWNMIYNYQVGLVNTLLRAVGLEQLALNWLGDPTTAMFAVCVTIIWQYIGLYFVIFLAALQNVPAELLEAAEIDGATGFAKTWLITIPLIRETILTAVVLCISGSLRTFDLIYVMTNGGPAHTTDVLATYMFNKTFSGLQYGYGSAVSMLIFFISLGLIGLMNLLLRRSGR